MSRRKPASKDEGKGSANAFNITVEGWEKRFEKSKAANDDEFELWDCNEQAVNVFMRCQTQWHFTESGVPLGMRYKSVWFIIEKVFGLHEPDSIDVFNDVCVMETAYLKALATLK